MSDFVRMPIYQAIAILAGLHALLCIAIAGLGGLQEAAVFAASAVASAYFSNAPTLAAHWTWLRKYRSQFFIWAVCSAAMTLFILYRSSPRIDVAFVEAASAGVFFMAMISLGNRVLK